MKLFNFVLTILLLVCLVATTAPAAGSTATKASKGVTKVSDEGMPPLHSANRAATVAANKSVPQPKFAAQPMSVNAISGTIHIGIAQPVPFKTLGSALSTLQLYGVATGGVTFLLDDATYTEIGIGIGNVTGSSATNPILIRPNTGAAPVVTLTNSSIGGGGFAIVGTQYLTINGTAVGGPAGQRDLTFQFDPLQTYPASSSNSVIRLKDGCNHVTIENCNIYSIYNTASMTSNALPGIAMTASGIFNNTNITFFNNLVARASVGIMTVGGGGDPDMNLVIAKNHIGNLWTSFPGQENYIQRTGIYVEYCDGLTMDSNQVIGLQKNRSNALFPGTSDLGRLAGTYQLWVMNATISRNNISSVTNLFTDASGSGRRTYGMRLSDFGAEVASGNVIVNNSVSNIWGKGSVSAGDIGMEVWSDREGLFIHNSIQHDGAGLETARNSVCLQMAGTGTGTGEAKEIVYNNAFVNKRTNSGLRACLRVFNNDALYGGGPDIASADFNVYDYQNGAVLNYAGASDLAGHIAANHFDSSSIAAPANFILLANGLHQTTGVGSSAKDLSDAMYVATDIDNEARPMDAKYDAGCDENATSLPFNKDAKAVAVYNLAASGIPISVAATPKAIVVNTTKYSLPSGWNIQIDVKDEFNVSVSGYPAVIAEPKTLGAGEMDTVGGFPSFTPTTNGPYTVILTTQLTGDLNPVNDQVTHDQPIVPKVTVTGTQYTTGFNTPVIGEAGWTWSGDFELSNSFTKLGGVYGGTGYTLVTVPGPPGTLYHTEGDDGFTIPNVIYSPFFDLSGMTGSDLFISFSHSISTEPDWDRSVFQYSVDYGQTWLTIPSAINPPDAINWGDTTVYANARVRNGAPFVDHFDNATWDARGLGKPYPAVGWSSASDGSPSGYVFNQIKFNTLAHNSFVRFRYIGFSDNNTAADGWAFDDFRLGSTGATFTGGNIKGTVFTDINGNGIMDGLDAGQVGVQLDFYYFGVLKGSATTIAGGVYTKAVTLPGIYTVKCTATGVAYSVPFASNSANLSHPADGTDLTQNFGLFVGSISGVKFSDLNDNGVKDPLEPGLAGWTIEVHKDSANHELVASAVTNVNGEYKFFLPPYSDYAVVEVAQPKVGRQTLPTGGHPHYVPVTDLSSTITGIDFGNFIYAIFTTEAVIDQNGNGVKEAADVFGLAGGSGKTYYNIYKDGVFYAQDTLMDGVKNKVLDSLDKAVYGWKRVSAIPAGWVETTPDTFTVDVNASGMTPLISFMYFKYTSVSGMKWNDLNGNGVKDPLEPPLAGVTINLSGNGTGYPMTTVTDVNGNYIFNNVGPNGDHSNSHTVSEVTAAGWTRTFPAGLPGTYTFNAMSGHNPLNIITDENFANFKNITVSGMLFRDRNNNGAQDAGEEGLSGWDVVLTPGSTIQTGVNGEFSFNVGPTPAGLTLNLTVPAGWTRTFPATVPYPIVAVSGANVSGKIFGVFKGVDATKYRTFTYAQLSTLNQKTPLKVPKVGKPILGAPSTANLIAQLVTELAAFQVGLSTQLGPDGKELAYLKPAKQADMFKSFYGKNGELHTLGAKPFAFTKAGKLMQKVWKSMPPDKKNDVLLAELLTLQVNLWSSAKGHTDAALNLGALLYTDAGPWGSGPITIDGIADYADNVMTNWIGVDSSIYPALYTAVKKINEAFANTVINDTIPGGGWFNNVNGKYKWATYKTVYEIPFLKAAVAPAKQRKDYTVEIPVQYTLGQNYPNPFNPTTNISFDIPTSSIVTLKIFNILGQEVAIVLNREEFSAGQQEVEFDASSLASGVYLYQIVAEQLTNDGNVGQTFTQVKKMILMK